MATPTNPTCAERSPLSSGEVVRPGLGDRVKIMGGAIERRSLGTITYYDKDKQLYKVMTDTGRLTDWLCKTQVDVKVKYMVGTTVKYWCSDPGEVKYHRQWRLAKVV